MEKLWHNRLDARQATKDDLIDVVVALSGGSREKLEQLPVRELGVLMREAVESTLTALDSSLSAEWAALHRNGPP